MKVKELKELLADLPDDHEVILSKDGEGNGFSPLADYGLQMYMPETTWCGEILSEEDVADGYGDEYKENAVILWPTN